MLCTIHQVHYNTPRQYYHRFVWLADDFQTMKYSRPFYFESRGVEFGLSMALGIDTVLLGYSTRDNTANIVVIDDTTVDTMVGL
jgi:hypothetical protein